MNKQSIILLSLLCLLGSILLFSCKIADSSKTYTLSATVSPEDSGEILIFRDGEQIKAPFEDKFRDGEQIELRAKPNDEEGWIFQRWEGISSDIDSISASTVNIRMHRNIKLVGIFKNLEPLPPSVTTAEVTDITATSVMAGGNVTSEGGDSVSVRGVCYATTEIPGLEQNCHEAEEKAGAGEFTVLLSDLIEDTTYYVRAYAVNSVGVSFGEQQEFSTRDGIPTLTTTEPFDVTAFSAKTGGDVSDDGGADITGRGVCYVEGSGEPDLSDTCVESGSGAGSFEVLLEDLAPDQQYTVRAYATTGFGTGWGQRREFTTLLRDSPWDTDTEVVEVTSHTGRIWMDRNLGASRAATSSTDSQAYGDLYQWGRAADGHQRRNSQTTPTLSSSDQPDHGSFILAPEPDSPYDWRSPQNNNLWQGIDGTNNPCPAGYRLPTEAEWEEEIESWDSDDAAGAFASPLKLPVPGNRSNSSGSLFSVGSVGYYWSSTVSGSNARGLYFTQEKAGIVSYRRALGFSVRCIKHVTNQ